MLRHTKRQVSEWNFILATRLFNFMFVTAVCVLFLIKIRCPKTKSIDLWFRHKLLLLLLLTFRPPFPGIFFLSERNIHRTTSLTSLRNWICQIKKKNPLTIWWLTWSELHSHSPHHIQSYCQSGYPHGLASNSEEGMMTEIEFTSSGDNFWRHFVCLSFGRRPRRKMYARVTRGGAKNSTFGYFNGTNPATGKGIQLQSPTPIMAPG